jgi:hypothetical protein
MIKLPFAALSNTPPGPASTSSTSVESGTMVAMTSALSTASAMLAAPRPPASISAATASVPRLKPTTSKPARTRFAAIGRPMIPSPMNAIFETVPLLMVRPLHRAEAI